MIKTQYKVALIAIPLLASGVLGATAVYPAFLEDQQKRSEVATRKQDNDRLLAKLRQKTQAEEERRNLESEISNLRGSVPKAPELDLFLIDLDKMCSETGVDLVAVENPEPESLKALDSSEEEVNKMVEESQGKLIGAKSADQKKDVSGKVIEQPDQTALKKLVKEVYVTSDYDSIIKLMQKLERYQRVTGVRQVAIALPGEASDGQTVPAAERAKKLGLHQPVMSFLMTLYYLP